MIRSDRGPLEPQDVVTRMFATAVQQPSAAAVVSRERTVDYAAFAARVRRFAAAIACAGEHPKVIVDLPQDVDAYAAMFGCLMAGGFYAPLNQSSPPERQSMVLATFDPDVIVTDRPDAPCYRTVGPDVFIVPARLGVTELAAMRAPHRLAYVMFTSGSTGRPKGVMIPRAGLNHYVEWAIPAVGFAPGERCSQHPNIGFDLSVIEIYGTLCGGAALVPLASQRDRALPACAVRDLQITIWVSVPSVIDMIEKAGQVRSEYLRTIKCFFFCGEPLLQTQVARVFDALPDVVVINAYGPTEATVSCTQIRLERNTFMGAVNAGVSLGNAIPGMSVEIVGGDERQGELVLAGPQLADGYWNDAQRTTAAFRTGPAGRSYYTGDWVRRIDSHLYFVCRVDRQVKIQGFRLELDEIDAALRECGFSGVVTVLDAGVLTSFVECSAELDVRGLQTALAHKLPAYAIPRDIRSIDRLPRGANDKIDIRELLNVVRS